MTIDSLFSNNGLPKDEIANFKAVLREASLMKGSLFVASEQMCFNIAIVETGYLRAFHLDEGGNEVTTDFFRSGDFCSSFYAFYSQQQAFESIQCITDCKLHLITLNALRDLYSQSFEINSFGRRVLEKVCMEKDFILKRIVHLPAVEKYTWFLQQYPDVAKTAKLGDIASFLRMKQETLSRVRRKLT